MSTFIKTYPSDLSRLCFEPIEVGIHRRDTAVDDEVMAANEAGIIARKKQHRPRDILRFQRHPLQVSLSIRRRLQLLRRAPHEPRGQWRCQRCCGDAVNPHPLPAQLRRRVPRQPHDPVFRARVRVRRVPRAHRRDARHRHDAPAPSPRHHRPRRVLRPQEGAHHVHRHHSLEICFLVLRDAPLVGRPHNAGVVEHDVKATELGDGMVDGAEDIVLNGDVAVDKGGGVADLGADGGTQLALDVGHDDLGAVLAEEAGGAGADAAGAAGDDSDLADKPGGET
ncbi:hypothetical protein HPP92_011909 [Vanilla planifolia]|uniref:Uncharacterized protein n=1 Tax=Vanilla planifolia TaxID=51239 RepID=A0A835R1J4_VANPL|nr:hypothetical protein HPP92_011909 [Vanilla planifolia]